MKKSRTSFSPLLMLQRIKQNPDECSIPGQLSQALIDDDLEQQSPKNSNNNNNNKKFSLSRNICSTVGKLIVLAAAVMMAQLCIHSNTNKSSLMRWIHPGSRKVLQGLKYCLGKPSKLAKRVENYNFKTILVPSFPHSNSQVFDGLIHDMTGLNASSLYNADKCTDRGTGICSTHWPAIKQRGEPSRSKIDFAEKSILLLRNPADAIYSQFEHYYQARRESLVNAASSSNRRHLQSQREEWMAWSELNFKSQIKAWSSFVAEWSNSKAGKRSFSVQKTRSSQEPMRLYVAYEDLVDETHGPKLSVKLRNALQQANMTVADEKDIPCLWHRSMSMMIPNWATTKSDDVMPRFTAGQRAVLVQTLDSALQKVKHDDELATILRRYKYDIEISASR